jgi:hypothetical protein
MMTVEEVASYIAELQRQFIVHRLRNYVMIIDVSACPIQAQDVVTAMGKHMVAMPKARAIAVVTGSSLARMQVRRLFTQPYARITRSVEDARKWVLESIEPPQG